MTSDQIIAKYDLELDGPTAADGTKMKRIFRDGKQIGIMAETEVDDWLQRYHIAQQAESIPHN